MSEVISELTKLGTNSLIIGFLTFQVQMQPTQEVRTWYMIGKILEKNPDITEEHFGNAIGEGLASMILEYKRISDQLIDPEDILTGKITEANLNINLQYTLAVVLSREVCENPTVERVDNFFRFIMDNFSDEMAIVAARNAMSIHKLVVNLSELTVFDEFHNRYGEYVKMAMLER